MGEFEIYRGTGEPDQKYDRIKSLSPPPPWRQFAGGPLTELKRDEPAGVPTGARRLHLIRAAAYRADPHTVRMVNVALHLRRPLLVTGYPGTGKSALAHAVAWELRLGQVLHWPITSRSTVDTGLYHYDAVGRIEQASLAAQHALAAQASAATRAAFAAQPGPAAPLVPAETPATGVAASPAGAGPELERHTAAPVTAAGTTAAIPDTESEIGGEAAGIGSFVRLGPLGTALAPFAIPRVLLIDEIDKSDLDLPNDLLNVFEEGEYGIRELARIADATPRVLVRPDDDGAPVLVEHGRVRCYAFPLVIMTSNDEREFPPAFLRRCVRLNLPQPDRQQIQEIIRAHLGPDAAEAGGHLVDAFLNRREQGQLATDQLLNALFLLYQTGGDTGLTTDELVDHVLHPLDSSD